MASLRGPRRTRVYNANYNIGESYYKSALDKLDRKYSGRSDPLDSSVTSSPRIRFNLDDGFDEDLQAARTRAARAITEEPVFDSRGKRTTAGFPLSSAFEDDIDEEIQGALSRIRANRPRATSLMKELDMDDSFTSSRIKRRMNLDMDAAGDDDFGKSSIKSRALARISRISAAEDTDEPIVSSSAKSFVSSYKCTAITDSSESANSAASIRARASKARLADIESEMTDRSEKLLQRERRAANLKKILADNDIEEVKSSKKVTF